MSLTKVDPTIYEELSTRFGLVVGGKDLAKALGFRSVKSLRGSFSRNALPIPVFQMAGRKGLWAKVEDVANWYMSLS